MTNASQKLIAASIIVATLVGLVSLLDLIIGVPFGRQTVMDVLFLIGAALVVYMGIDTYRETQ
ncbi:MAG: hypothetical protein WD648_05175 [Planctomycetaceae bacterium]